MPTALGRLYCHIERSFPDTIVVGAGTVQVVQGHCFHTEWRVRRIVVTIGDTGFPVARIHEPREDVAAHRASVDPKGHSLRSGFWTMVPITPDLIGTAAPVRFRVLLSNGSAHEVSMGTTRFEGARADAGSGTETSGVAARVAICMATYNPGLNAFRRQIESIVRQTETGWVCLISDDASALGVFRRMQEICASDPRIVLCRNEANLGFYRNFERCLRRVPASARYVALADQDDYWYPEKLQRCLAAFRGRTALVYSDMRIVTGSGEVLSNTYWTRRRNSYDDLEVLLLANTVTGAASVFRAELLRKILPFPERIGDAFHDHWIACVAMMAGGLEYLDEPLYDYVQHRENAIGHSDFPPSSLGLKVRRLGATVSRFGDRRALNLFRMHLLAVYVHEYRRLQVNSRVLELRFPEASGRERRALRVFSDSWATVPALARVGLKVWRRGLTTDDAEARLGLGYLMAGANRIFYRVSRRPLMARLRDLHREPAAAPSIRASADTLAAKTAPLVIRTESGEPTRVNLLIPEVNFEHFFGGYIAKFHLARRLAERGRLVRLVIVDYCDHDPGSWQDMVRKYDGLESFFDHVEVADCFDRTKPIVMNPEDALIATTWWTAHIAHAATRQLQRDRFVYFIQEYEPFTFPMGSYHAFARESYDFPHYAIFSTRFLLEYFESERIGVYGAGSRREADAAYFENAILTFDLDPDEMSRRRPYRVLLYARPESHASRNMFETALLALVRAIGTGVFPEGAWEFYGIGSAREDVALPGGQRLRMLGKVGLKEYRELLPQHDVGLSLMYTPHPSLVPLEMAAAGMMVVTNAWMNKTPEAMAGLSANIIAGEPTVEGVVESLRTAVGRVDRYGARVLASKVEWPTSWDEALSEDLLRRIDGWIGDQGGAPRVFDGTHDTGGRS